MAKRILIIEDELSIAELEKDYLELSEFEVVIKSDGMSGLEEALLNDYDLVLLDVMLPGLDGFEVLTRLRAVKDTPILIVTAKKEDVDKIKGLGLGADDYITKPFSPSEVVARVKAHLTRYSRLKTPVTESSNEINVRGLKINKSARKVWVNGEEKPLTTREFDLLMFFIEHPNRVYTKEELFKNVWNMEYTGNVATVTVHIKKLREKIELNVANPQYIETIWGVGYRFRI